MGFSFEWTTNQKRIRTEIITKQYPYISDVFREIITNSIDAAATNVNIEIYKNLINGISKVVISDNGYGMQAIMPFVICQVLAHHKLITFLVYFSVYFVDFQLNL